MHKTKVEFRIKERVVYDLDYMDESGRWIRYGTYGLKKDAEKGIKPARAEMTRIEKWKKTFNGQGMDPGRERKRSVHGEDM